jgi:hypothetical protein
MKTKIFVSYYHSEDRFYKDKFEELFTRQNQIFLSGSVHRGDISFDSTRSQVTGNINANYLQTADLVVVLIGQSTFKRYYVDHEIYSAIRNKDHPKGLLGLVLPTREDYNSFSKDWRTYPGRLLDNLKRRYAVVVDWSEDPSFIAKHADDALRNARKYRPDNRRRPLLKNQKGDIPRYGKSAIPRLQPKEYNK